jgi:glycosyltransferase involved in cell wall biosynthesis
MRIAVLTPGTGSFHCGTCLRDQALAKELRRLGHDVLFVPLYLPPTLDTADENTSAVYMGGINVYLQHTIPFFRKTPRWVDKLFDSPAALASAAKRAGMTQAKDLGPMTLTMLKGEDGHQVKELDRLAGWLRDDVRPDVVLLSNILLVGIARRIREITNAMVWCTLHGEDTFLDALPESHRGLCWQEVINRSKHVDGFIAVSRTYGDIMIRRAELDPTRVHVVHNGVDVKTYKPTSKAKGNVIGYLARQCYGKGLHLLVDAFIACKKSLPDARLVIVGTKTAADEDYVAGIKQRLSEAGCLDAVSFHDNVSLEEKVRLLQQMDVLSVPALYGESFGLYVIEALACGVPVVAPTHGAFPELAAETGGVALFDQNVSGDYEKTLTNVLGEQGAQLSTLGREAILERFSTASMAAGVVAAFESHLKKAV